MFIRAFRNKTIIDHNKAMHAVPSGLIFALFASGSSSFSMQNHERGSSPTSTNLYADSNASPSNTARAKRKLKIGLAKAVDRGNPNVATYAPLCNGTFHAASGTTAKNKTPFLVLGIESSCDDTGAAIVRSDGVILGEGLAKQNEIHEAWGGVVPGLARDAHVDNMDRVVQEAVTQAGLDSIADVDAIAVTVGPGLEICLRVGCQKAVALAKEYGKPFVGVHHLEAHILMARLSQTSGEDTSPNNGLHFPFLALLVSGGHCQLMECIGIGQYKILGGTLDDSLGEAYDKTARLLGLPVGGGGGPAVEALARKGNPKAIPMTVPMHARKDCDFSYAGLKSNVRRQAQTLADERGVAEINDLTETDKADIAASFQHVAIQHVEQRLKRAMDEMVSPNIRDLALVGGVAANTELRQRVQALCDEREWRMVVPPPRLCTDQGAMSAWAGVERLLVGSSDAIAEDVYARYPFSRVTEE